MSTRQNKRRLVTAAVSLLAVFIVTSGVWSHCEIPCGIYDDPIRISSMYEDIRTIEKSMRQIHKLAEEKDKNYNQLVRWIENKGDHADKLSDTVTQYFMKQRIKPAEKIDVKAYDKYVKRITLLHKLMVYSMKCKQTTDLDNVEVLRNTLTEFKREYLVTEHNHKDHNHKH